MSDAGVRRSAVLLFSLGQTDAVEVLNTSVQRSAKNQYCDDSNL